MPRITTIPPELIGQVAILHRRGYTPTQIAKAMDKKSAWVRSILARYSIGQK